MNNNYKIIHLNQSLNKTSVPYRLMIALRTIGIDSDILCFNSQVDDDHIHQVKKSFAFRVLRKLDHLILGIQRKRYPDKNEEMPFSYYHIGADLIRNQMIKDADIIFVHWTYSNFLSLHGLSKLIKTNKPVFLVCHDNCHFTGGCHVRLGCDKYMNSCGRCPELGSQNDKDWSYVQLKTKRRVYKANNISVISPSTWMDENVSNSAVLRGKRHFVIPNPIDTKLFAPLDRQYVRNKYSVAPNRLVLLFGAVKAVSTPYKGYKELLEALELMANSYSQVDKIEAYIFGSSGETEYLNEKITMHYLGFLSEEEMVEAYNLSDVYVVPSLEDSFNNTVAESLATETPVVSFETGGITDIIDHKINGYLARYGDSKDLAEGINWVLNNNHDNTLGKNGRKKVISKFSYEKVATMYKDLIFESKH
jgi:glycosyltransferase involved in cell wall biosynthesis